MLNRLSINALLKTVIVTLGGAFAIALAIGAWSSWTRLAAADRAAAVTDVSADLFSAINDLRGDRALTSRELHADPLPSVDPLIQSSWDREMPALNAALVALRNVNLPDRQELMATLAEHIKRLTALHEESATALLQPKSARPPGLAEEESNETQDLFNFIDKLSNRLAASIRLQDAYIDQLMELKQLAWVVRNVGGDATMVISGTLAGRPLPPNAMDSLIANMAKVDATWAALKDLAHKLPLPPSFAEAVSRTDQGYLGPASDAQRVQVLKALIAGKPPGVTSEEWSRISVESPLSVVAVAQIALDTARDYAKQQASAALESLVIQLCVLAIVVVMTIGMVAAVSVRVARPLRQLSAAMDTLADGDFTVTMPDSGRKDEVGMIAAAAQAVVDRLGTTIGNIKMAANEVTSASAEISTSTTDLSQRTEEQAASLEETSASMEEISATVKKNAENAQQANAFAVETSTVAERGGAVVSDAVSAMARIEESSRKISDIITVIDEIARQTNLLALNAAVEAARAGEAGRGFAVVASEVRSLAQRSSQAAKDIKDLITNSNSQVKDGVDLVNKAGESLSEIVASIKKVATIVADIANASLEQSSGLEQVNKALLQMDEVTQQNSALVEENAATAKTLEQQAKSMDERVASFRLRAQAARAARATAMPVAEDEAADEIVRPAASRQEASKRVVAAASKRAVNGSGRRVA
jgi:methyl-accepting chemotaxis protein